MEGRPVQILYIVCDPATWARDLNRLGQAGYQPCFVRPYDFYPFTHHAEISSLLAR